MITFSSLGVDDADEVTVDFPDQSLTYQIRRGLDGVLRAVGTRTGDVLSEEQFDRLLKLAQGWSASKTAAPPARKPGVVRARVLDEASRAVLQDRTVTHGADLEQSFAAIAAHWSVLFGVPVEPHQVPLAMNLLKIVRANNNPKHLDNWTDQAGYAACGAEIAEESL